MHNEDNEKLLRGLSSTMSEWKSAWKNMFDGIDTKKKILAEIDPQTQETRYYYDDAYGRHYMRKDYHV